MFLIAILIDFVISTMSVTCVHEFSNLLDNQIWLLIWTTLTQTSTKELVKEKGHWAPDMWSLSNQALMWAMILKGELSLSQDMIGLFSAGHWLPCFLSLLFSLSLCHSLQFLCVSSFLPFISLPQYPQYHPSDSSTQMFSAVSLFDMTFQLFTLLFSLHC